MMVCWTFTRKLTPVLMKLSERWPKYAYGHIISLWRINLSLLSCFPQLFLSMGVKVRQERKLKGMKWWWWWKLFVERTFHGCESSMERKFLEHSLLRSESSGGAKVLWNENFRTFRSPWANVPRNESYSGAKLLSMDFSLPGTKVQRNEKSGYRAFGGVPYRWLSANYVIKRPVKACVL